MAAIKCSYCGSENGESTASCRGCGTRLHPEAPQVAYASIAQDRIIRGAVWLGAGLLVTFVTFMAAQPTGNYWVVWSPIAFGIFLLITGLSDTRKSQAQL